jgi:hypothetical protein
MKKLGRPTKIRSTKRGPHRYEFTPKEEAFIRENFHLMSNRELARAVGLTQTIVRTRCYAMGLKKMEMDYWTPVMIRFLRANYRKMGDVELAEIFAKRWPKNKGWRQKHIAKKRMYLQLDRTAGEIVAIKLRNKKTGRWALCPVKRWDKTGRSPEGTIRTWRHTGAGSFFKVIKIGGKFVHYARWLYEQRFGKMPPGYVIGFKDLNNLNVVVENLESISRAEHVRRNGRTIPADVREATKLINSLNELINQKDGKEK